MIRRKLLVFIIGITLLSLNVAEAVEITGGGDGQTLIPDKTQESITIDGELDEKVWTRQPVDKDFITINPRSGELLEQKTKAWLAYDSSNLYFAFKCYDPEPHKIKSTIAQRDRIYRDDLIGILIDSMGTKQTGYELYINPRGIQGDGLNSSASGPDMAPDFVWESAAKLTDFGFQVELRLPLKSIRFKGGKDVDMRLLFIRQVSRSGVSASWPQLVPGQSDFNCMINVRYKNLKPGLKREVLPNFVYSSTSDRADDQEWGDADIAKNVGVAVKYGVTSAITAEVTVNPDFSQVESDAYPVDVNQRYPVFYTEKRPFFMEGAKTFDFGLTVENYVQLGMMTAAIHTRRIVDPGWAAKLSGNTGKLTFGFLGANDRAPEQTWGSLAQANAGKDSYWAIARGKYNMGSDNSLGLLYSGSFLGEGKNNTLGLDLQYRLNKNTRLFVNYLHTDSKLSPDSEKSIGSGFNALVQFRTKKLETWALYERYDENFNMHSAFINRIGIGRGRIFVGPVFYPRSKALGWIKRFQPWIDYTRLKDLGTGLRDTEFHYGFDVSFRIRLMMELSLHNVKEAWQGQLFDQKFFHFWCYGQLTGWLQTQIYFWVGDQIYYDSTDPFMGTGPRGNVEITLEPLPKFKVDLDWNFNSFKRKSTKEKIYSFNILNTRLTYQFSRHFLVRAALRYNDYEKKLLTDLLASFTLIPGTVMHLGYGSLYENKIWRNNQWITGTGDLLRMKNSLFFKVSYLWQIK